MAKIAYTTKSGNSYIDSLLCGNQWRSPATTFSFPASGSYYVGESGESDIGFDVFNTQQQSAVRSVLKSIDSFSNMSFKEVQESMTVHGELRYAETSQAWTSYAYTPNTQSFGGDSWYNHTLYNDPSPGNYAYTTMLHETGHAIGLKHPHERAGSFPVMPSDQDSLEYSVMSYRSFTGGRVEPYTVSNGSYPQTMMMLDISAIQHMYGADFTTNTGNTEYSWDSESGQMYLNGVSTTQPISNKVFMTVWDGGGNDTYNFSDYSSDLSVNLTPGAWSITSQSQLAELGYGHLAAGNIANALLYKNNPASLIENVVGGSGNDVIVGNQADNCLTGGAGNDSLTGGVGVDTAIFSGFSTDYSVLEQTDGSLLVFDNRVGTPDGSDRLVGIEYLMFGNALVDVVGGVAGLTSY